MRDCIAEGIRARLMKIVLRDSRFAIERVTREAQIEEARTRDPGPRNQTSIHLSESLVFGITRVP